MTSGEKKSAGERELLSPKLDLVFKRIFGDRRNVDILQDFLVAVIDIPEEEYDTIEIVDPHLRHDHEKDKIGILDILVKTKSGKLINIEIQVLEEPYMAERVAYYTSKLLTSQIASGGKYESLKKVISIVILNYKLIKDSEDYHNRYWFRNEKNGSTLTDIIEINTLELPKLPPAPEGDDVELFYWLRFIKAERREEFEMAATKSPAIRKAYGVLKELSADERERLLADSRDKFLWDVRAGMHGSYDKGLVEGERKGIIEGKLETARKLLARGFDAGDIADLTGLSEEQIRALD